MMTCGHAASSAQRTSEFRFRGALLGALASLLLSGCSGDVLDDLLDDLKPGGHHPGGGHHPPPPPPPPSSCGSLSWDTVFEHIEADILQLDAEDREFQRYVTLANKRTAGECGAALDDDRQALSKLLNSVSRETQIGQPVLIRAETDTYRFDLRDYGLDDASGPFEVDGVQFVDGWEAVIANSPFAVEFQGDQAENVQLLANTLVPVLFADAFAHEVVRRNLYYGLVGIPATRAELELNVGVDFAGDDAQEITIRAGANIDGRDFIAQRNVQSVGGLGYWQVADFGLRQGGIFDDPLGDLRGEREVVYHLPNGLFGFALFDANGARLEESSVLFDNSLNDLAYVVARSPLRRYGQGFAFEDQLRQDVLDNLIDYGQIAEISDLLDRYPSGADLQDIIAADNALYAAALARAGVPLNASEPISSVLDQFDEDVDLAVVGGDLLFPADRLAPEVPRLDPALSGLDNGFGVDRGDWQALYVNTLCITSVANENRPADQVCIDAGVFQ
jgi:hypothetical protein